MSSSSEGRFGGIAEQRKPLREERGKSHGELRKEEEEEEEEWQTKHVVAIGIAIAIAIAIVPRPSHISVKASSK
mgnify:CR=1 FL=1